MQPIRIGIVGTGYAAAKRAESIQAESRSQLIAVLGHKPENAQKFATTYGIQIAQNPKQLLKDFDLDLIMICNVNQSHYATAQQALEAGKHLVVEYPLALTSQEAKSLIDLAKTHNLLIHVEHIELLGGLHQTLREYLPHIGKVFAARYTTVTPKNPAPRHWTYNHNLFGFPWVGALSRCHRLTDLFGEVKSVNAQARFWDGIDPDYHSGCYCTAQLEFTSGVRAELAYGKGETIWMSDRRFIIQGELGSLVFLEDQGTLITPSGTIPLSLPPRTGLFAQDTKLVLDYLLEGKPLYVNPQASLYALTVAEYAQRSSELGEMIRLPKSTVK